MKYDIFNGDCVDGLKRIGAESIDLTVTSPPYDALRTYDGYAKAFNFKPLADELYRVTKKGGVIVWIVNDMTIKGSETGSSFRQALYFKDIGFNLHDTMIWQKAGCTAPETNRYYPNFEYMFVLSKGKPKTANLLQDRKNINAGKKVHGTVRDPDGTLRIQNGRRCGRLIKDYGVRWNIWKITQDRSKKIHPAVFPVKLVEDHIKTWSNENDVVLDPLMGSGTTGVACINLNRNFIGFEISEEYFSIAKERIDTAMAS